MKKILLRLFISFGLLIWLFWSMRENVTNVWGTILACDYKIISAAITLLLVNTLFMAYRLKVIFAGEDLSITFSESVQLTFIGYFFNNFLPTAVGGDIVKAHYAAQASSEKLRSYASVLMDRFIGLYTFLILADIALVIDWGRLHLVGVRPLVALFTILGLAVYIITTHDKLESRIEGMFKRLKLMGLGERLHSVYSVIHDYKNRTGVVAKSVIISIFAQCLYFFMIYMLFAAVSADMRIGVVFLLMPIIVFISMIPSLGGLGVREGAIVALFSPVVGRDISFAVSLLVLAGVLLLSVIGGFVYLWWMVKKKAV